MALLVAVFVYATLGVYRALPAEPGKSPWESDFWELMRRRDEERDLAAAAGGSASPDTARKAMTD
jgi:hypothetical protein